MSDVRKSDSEILSNIHRCCSIFFIIEMHTTGKNQLNCQVAHVSYVYRRLSSELETFILFLNVTVQLVYEANRNMKNI
jgi:hypothetical protein